MKRILTGAAALIIMLCSLMPAFGAAPKIKIDGDWGDWLNTSHGEDKDENRPKTSNHYNSCTYWYIVSESENTVYYYFTFSTGKSVRNVDEARNNMGIEFTPTNCKTVRITGEETSGNNPVYFETDNSNSYYRISAALKIQDSDGSLFVEAKVVYVKGLPSPITCTVSAFDEEGTPSNDVTVYVSLNDNTDEGSNNSDKKTTAEKTTKEAATRKNSAKTTAKSGEDEGGHRADYAADGATRKHTTDAYKELDKLIAGAGKTAAESSKSGESKAKSTTKKSKTKSSGKKAADKSETAEAGEEIITSIVYITQNTETASATQAEETAGNGSAFGSKGIRSSTALKAAAGACALVLFGVIGVWAVKSREGESEEE
ncbi:MAG: hypothetical protein IJJ61_05040 [Clostridia bacterium]|nr:hypothetical protein [Clostridia bacterium]